MRKVSLLATLCICAVLFASCDELDNLNPKQTSTVCRALIGPIKYNTYNKLSQRYAAMLLASDLHQRNLVGTYLKCPQYRKRGK